MTEEVFKALTEKDPPKRNRPRIASIRVKGLTNPSEGEITFTFYVLNDISDQKDDPESAIHKITKVWIQDINDFDAPFIPKEITIIPANSENSENNDDHDHDIFLLTANKVGEELQHFQIKDIVIGFKIENDKEPVQVYDDIPIFKG